MAQICCDTSFLFSLYGLDSKTRQAVAFLGQLRQPVALSILNEFELENSIRLSIFGRKIDSTMGAAMLVDYAVDKRQGKVVLVDCDLSEVLAQAKGLSLAHSQSGGHRAYDILHVAAALRLGAQEFLTFDANQRKLAKAAGLKVRPV
jgi:predicted nucleic acid-binding protein